MGMGESLAAPVTAADGPGASAQVVQAGMSAGLAVTAQQGPASSDAGDEGEAAPRGGQVGHGRGL
jgi:hypothetical protein